MKRAYIAFLLAAAMFQPVEAQGEFDFDTEETSPAEEKKQGVSIPIRGKVNAESAYQSGSPKRITRLGISSNLLLDYKTKAGLFYSEVTGRFNSAYLIENDSQDVINNYTLVVILREAYWKKPFGSFTLSAGNIITIIGKADILPVLNVLTASDRTQSFFANPDEARLGQNSIKVEWFNKNNHLSLLFIPYPVYDRITDNDHPYSITPGLILKNARNTREVEGALVYDRQIPRGGFSLLAGRVNNRSPVISSDLITASFYKNYQPFWFTGASINVATAPFLWKAELGYHFDQPQQRLTMIPAPLCTANCIVPSGVAERDRISSMIGFDYNAGNQGNLIYEMSYTSMIDADNGYAQNRGVLTYALGWSNTYLKDDLSTVAFLYAIESIRNLLFRLQATYKFDDRFSVMAQYTGIFIGAFTQDYGIFADLDRVDLMLTYNFDLAQN